MKEFVAEIKGSSKSVVRCCFSIYFHGDLRLVSRETWPALNSFEHLQGRLPISPVSGKVNVPI